MVDSQGRLANKMGKALEDSIEDALLRSGFTKLDNTTKAKFRRSLHAFGDEDLGKRWFARNLKKYKNLYDVGFFADFVVYDAQRYPRGLVIEVKNQSTPGSVDEKYVFTVLSLRRLYEMHEGMSSWLVMDGAGVRDCAIEWVRKQTVWSDLRRQFRLLTPYELRRALLDEFGG